MRALTVRDTFPLMGAFLLVLIFAGTLVYLVRARRSDRSVLQVFLAGPLLWLRPRDYFANDKVHAPWRALLWWCLSLLLISALAKQLPIWLDL